MLISRLSRAGLRTLYTQTIDHRSRLVSLLIACQSFGQRPVPEVVK